MQAKNLKHSDTRHHYHPATNPVTHALEGDNYVERAEGIYYFTEQGQKIIDAGSGLSNVSLGYGNRRICKAAYQAMQQLSYCHCVGGRTNQWTAALSEKLAAISPDGFSHFNFTSTGSDAIESAIKMALYYWRLNNQPSKRAIISRYNSYHGNTLFAASLTGIDTYHTQFGLPITDLIHHLDSPDWYQHGQHLSPHAYGLQLAKQFEDKILQVGAENIAAFVAEPIQLATAMIIPPESYWPAIRTICDRYNILLIADEVITGLGKTGQLFGFQNFGFEPDLFVMAKGLTSGYFPLAAIALGDKISKTLMGSDETFWHLFTNAGHPVGAAVALECLAIIEEASLVERVRDDIGPYFSERLSEFLKFPIVSEVLSMGVLGGIRFDITNSKTSTTADNLQYRIYKVALKNGLAMRTSGLVLPMTISRSQVDDVINLLMASFEEVMG